MVCLNGGGLWLLGEGKKGPEGAGLTILMTSAALGCISGDGDRIKDGIGVDSEVDISRNSWKGAEHLLEVSALSCGA